MQCATPASHYDSDPLIEQSLADLPVVFPAISKPIEEIVDDETADQFSARPAVPSVAAPAVPAPAPAPTKRRSSSKRPRKSRERDARNGRIMERLDPRTSTSRKRALVATPLLSQSPSNTPLSTKPKNKRQKANDRDRRLMAAWRHAGDVIRMKAMTRSVEEIGVQAFTLNLSTEIEAAALKNPLKAKSYLFDRLTKAFRKHFKFPVDFAFVLEFTPAGRLHIHGIIVITAEQKKLATQALMEAGGTWDAAHPEFQADVRKLWDGYGWANYIDKSSSRTRKILGLKETASILSKTQNLGRLGETYWEGLRAKEKRERAARPGTSPARQGSSPASAIEFTLTDTAQTSDPVSERHRDDKQVVEKPGKSALICIEALVPARSSAPVNNGGAL